MIGRSRSVRASGRRVAVAERRHALLERRDDGRQRLHQRDEAARGDGAGADLADVGAVDGGGAVGEGVRRGVPAARAAGGGEALQVAELHQLRGDRVGRRHHREERDEPQPGEHAARHQHARDLRADDVADAQVLGRDVAAQDRRRQVAVGGADRQRRRLGDEAEDLLQERVDEREPQPLVGGARQIAAALAGDQHRGAGRPFGVGEGGVLLDDERPPQRDHHQDAEHAADHRQREDRPVGEVRLADADAGGRVAAEEQKPRQGEHHAGRDRLARRPDRLDDVVLQDRRRAEPLEDRDRQHRDRDRRRDGEAGLERQVDRGGAEDHPEQHPQHDGARRQLGEVRLGRDVGGGQGARAGLRVRGRAGWGGGRRRVKTGPPSGRG